MTTGMARKNELRVLVTGAGGMLGRALLQTLSKSCAVTGLSSQSKPSDMPGSWITSNLLDERQLQAAIADCKPDVIVHAASSVFVNECEKHRDQTWALHVGVSKQLVECSRRADAHLIYISTDSVFDGTKSSLYKESDPTNPLNFYALTKLMGERAALDYGRALVLRTNIFGWRSDHRLSFGQWVLAGLKNQNVPLTMFPDVLFTPISTFEFAKLVDDCIRSGVTGLYHAGGADRISKHDFAMRLAARLGLSTSHVVATSIDSVEMGAPRPKNTGLNNSRLAERLSRQMPTLDESIETWLSRAKVEAPKSGNVDLGLTDANP